MDAPAAPLPTDDGASAAPPARPAPGRPAGVALACILGIVLGGLEFYFGLALLAGAVLWAPADAGMGGSFLVAGVYAVLLGGLSFASAVGGMKGARWARWMLLAAFLLTLLNLPDGVLGLLLLAPLAAGVVALLRRDAAAWFAARRPAAPAP